MTSNTETSFDVLSTELYKTMEESNKYFLDQIANTTDPLELVGLMTDYAQFVGELNGQVIGAIIESCTVYQTGDYH